MKDGADEFLKILNKEKETSTQNLSLNFASLSDFTLLETLGTGTFGIAKLCVHTKTKNHFCIKILNKERIIRLKQETHIKNEKDVLSTAIHPFIVKLYATFQDKLSLYFLMEYIPGGELFTRIRRNGFLSENVTRFYTSEIVIVLEYLHSRRICHRDLKPVKKKTKSSTIQNNFFFIKKNKKIIGKFID